MEGIPVFSHYHMYIGPNAIETMNNRCVYLRLNFEQGQDVMKPFRNPFARE